MANVTRTTTWSDNQVLTAAALNGEFNNLLNALGIVNTDISSGAAIALTKLAGTFPASQIIVGTTDTQTLSGKTLTKPIINGSIQGLTTDTDGATITFDLSASNIHSVVLGGTRTLALSNAAVGQIFMLRLIQDGTGSKTVTWFTTIKWVNGTAPTLSTGINKIDTFVFVCTSTGNYDGYVGGQNLA